MKMECCKFWMLCKCFGGDEGRVIPTYKKLTSPSLRFHKKIKSEKTVILMLLDKGGHLIVFSRDSFVFLTHVPFGLTIFSCDISEFQP